MKIVEQQKKIRKENNKTRKSPNTGIKKNINLLGHRIRRNKLNRRKSGSIVRTTKRLIKANKSKKAKAFGMNHINQTMIEYKTKNIKSLKQNLNKRVMEYKTMHNIKLNNKDS
jgi:hypothetical protein